MFFCLIYVLNLYFVVFFGIVELLSKDFVEGIYFFFGLFDICVYYGRWEICLEIVDGVLYDGEINK